MGTDNKSVIALRKSLRQFTADPVRFLRGNLTRRKGLPQLIGNYIVRPSYPACLGDILSLCQKKLGIGGAAIVLAPSGFPFP